MATAWIDPSWLMVHSDIGRRSCRKASTSSSVILDDVALLDPVAHLLGGAVPSVIRVLLGHGVRSSASGRPLGAAYRRGPPYRCTMRPVTDLEREHRPDPDPGVRRTAEGCWP